MNIPKQLQNLEDNVSRLLIAHKQAHDSGDEVSVKSLKAELEQARADLKLFSAAWKGAVELGLEDFPPLPHVKRDVQVTLHKVDSPESLDALISNHWDVRIISLNAGLETVDISLADIQFPAIIAMYFKPSYALIRTDPPQVVLAVMPLQVPFITQITDDESLSDDMAMMIFTLATGMEYDQGLLEANEIKKLCVAFWNLRASTINVMALAGHQDDGLFYDISNEDGSIVSDTRQNIETAYESLLKAYHAECKASNDEFRHWKEAEKSNQELDDLFPQQVKAFRSLLDAYQGELLAGVVMK